MVIIDNNIFVLNIFHLSIFHEVYLIKFGATHHYTTLIEHLMCVIFTFGIFTFFTFFNV